MTETHLIPRTIHYCWYGGSRMSELGRLCLQTWRDVMPDYALEAWDESRLDMEIPYISIAYRARKFAFVADYMRLKILYEHGGVYLDTDVEVLRRFDDLLQDELFLGLETPDRVAAGVIGGVRGHPFLKRALDRLDAEGRSGKPSYQPLPQLLTELAGSKAATTPRLYPEEYFYPYNPYSPVALRRKPLQANISERTHSIHHWEGSWLGDMSLRMLIGVRLKELARRVRSWRRGGPAPATVR